MRVAPPNLPNFRNDGISAPLLQGGRILVYVIWRLKPAVYDVPLSREYVTSDIMGSLTFSRGRTIDSVSLGSPEVGQCRFSLLNTTGRYSPANTIVGGGSPLYQESTIGNTLLSNVGIGRLVKVVYFQEGATSASQGSTLWTGVVTSVRPSMLDFHLPVVDIICSGPLWFFGDRQIEIQETSTKTTLQLAKEIIESPAFDSRKGIGKFNNADSNWATSIANWQPGAGSGLSHLGSLEVQEATYNIREDKGGTITLWNGTRASQDTAMILLDRAPDSSDGLTTAELAKTYLISDLYQPSNEELIYSCFRWSVRTAVIPVSYPSDVSSNGVLIHTWLDTTPPSFLIEYSQSEQIEIEVKLDSDFTDIGLLPNRTRVTFVKSNSNNDPTDLDTPIVGTPTALPSFIQTIAVAKDPNSPANKVLIRIARNASEPSVHYWVQKIELFGIRKYLPDGVTDIIRCINRESIENDYGRREFPYAPVFFNQDAGEKWGNKMAARYGDTRYRFTVSVKPQNEAEMTTLADLDIHDLVAGHFYRNSGVFMPLGSGATWTLDQSWRTMVVERIECEFDEDKYSTWRLDLIDYDFYRVADWPASGWLLDDNDTESLGK